MKMDDISSILAYGDSDIVIRIMNMQIFSLKNQTYMQCYIKAEELSTNFEHVSYNYIQRNKGMHGFADRLSKVTDADVSSVRGW